MKKSQERGVGTIFIDFWRGGTDFEKKGGIMNDFNLPTWGQIMWN